MREMGAVFCQILDEDGVQRHSFLPLICLTSRQETRGTGKTKEKKAQVSPILPSRRPGKTLTRASHTGHFLFHARGIYWESGTRGRHAAARGTGRPSEVGSEVCQPVGLQMQCWLVVLVAFRDRWAGLAGKGRLALFSLSRENGKGLSARQKAERETT